jgi:hypothetical protein
MRASLLAVSGDDCWCRCWRVAAEEEFLGALCKEEEEGEEEREEGLLPPVNNWRRCLWCGRLLSRPSCCCWFDRVRPKRCCCCCCGSCEESLLCLLLLEELLLLLPAAGAVRGSSSERSKGSQPSSVCWGPGSCCLLIVRCLPVPGGRVEAWGRCSWELLPGARCFLGGGPEVAVARQETLHDRAGGLCNAISCCRHACAVHVCRREAMQGWVVEDGEGHPAAHARHVCNMRQL